MKFISNSTFIINILNTDISILDKIEVLTIPRVYQEVSYELGIDLNVESNIKKIQPQKSNPKIPPAKQDKISYTDLNLLKTAFKNRQNYILITDDKVLRSLAKNNKIKTYTTPQIIFFIVNKAKISINYANSFLNKLKAIYIRPKDIDRIKEYINKRKRK